MKSKIDIHVKKFDNLILEISTQIEDATNNDNGEKIKAINKSISKKIKLIQELYSNIWNIGYESLRKESKRKNICGWIFIIIFGGALIFMSIISPRELLFDNLLIPLITFSVSMTLWAVFRIHIFNSLKHKLENLNIHMILLIDFAMNEMYRKANYGVFIAILTMHVELLHKILPFDTALFYQIANLMVLTLIAGNIIWLSFFEDCIYMLHRVPNIEFIINFFEKKMTDLISNDSCSSQTHPRKQPKTPTLPTPTTDH